MKLIKTLALAACLVLPLAACNKEEAKQVVAAPVPAPTVTRADSAASTIPVPVSKSRNTLTGFPARISAPGRATADTVASMPGTMAAA